MPCPVAHCRHRSLALVCRQWAELVHSPALLGSSLDIAVHRGSSNSQLLARLRSLVEWVARHAAGRVHRLSLRVEAWLWLQHQQREPATAPAELLVAALLAAGGSLREASLTTLNLELPPLAAQLAPLTQLTSLSVDANGSSIMLEGPLTCLPSLQRLRLSSHARLLAQPGASLPPALTRLYLRGLRGRLPVQVNPWSSPDGLHASGCLQLLRRQACGPAYHLLPFGWSTSLRYSSCFGQSANLHPSAPPYDSMALCRRESCSTCGS